MGINDKTNGKKTEQSTMLAMHSSLLLPINRKILAPGLVALTQEYNRSSAE